jgi:hypothetical protein
MLKGLETSLAPSGLGPEAVPTTLYVDPVLVTAGAGPILEVVYVNGDPIDRAQGQIIQRGMFTRTEIQGYAVVFTAEVGEDHTGRHDAFDVILDMPSLTVHDDRASTLHHVLLVSWAD